MIKLKRITEKVRSAEHINFAIRLEQAKFLAWKLADVPYAFDLDGKDEFEHDLKDLKELLRNLHSDYLNKTGDVYE